MFAVCMAAWSAWQINGELRGVEQAHTLTADGLATLQGKLEKSSGGVAVADTEALRKWVLKLQVAVAAVVVMFGLAVAYGIWKDHALRFADARSSLLEGLMVRVRRCMHDRDKPLEERRADVTDIVLQSVECWTRVNAWVALRTMARFRRQKPLESTVLYFVPASPEPRAVIAASEAEMESLAPASATVATDDGLPGGIEQSEQESNAARGFRIAAYAHNPKVSESVAAMYRRLADNHCAAPWNTDVFCEKVRRAKGRNERGWRRRYLNMPREHDEGSVTGYVFSEHVVVVAEDTNECLAFDPSYLDELKSAGVGDDVIQWVAIRSFVACHVPGGGREAQGVLFVGKNYSHGFGPEDEEFAVAASHVLATALSYEDRQTDT